MQRTITTTKVTYLTRGEGRELVEKQATVIGEVDAKSALKKVQKIVDDTVYEVIGLEVNEALYKCSDEDFLAIAKPVEKKGE